MIGLARQWVRGTLGSPRRLLRLGCFLLPCFLFRCTSRPPRFPASPLSFLRPRHHGPKLRAHPLDLVLTVGLAQPLEVGTARPALRQPFAGKRSVAHLVQDLLHGGSSLLSDDLWAAGVVAV